MKSKVELKKIAFLFVLTLLCASFSGCNEKISTDNADDILSKVYMRADTLDDYSYTMYVNSNLGENNTTEKYSIIWKKPVFMKGTFQVSNIDSEIIMISNQSMQLIYNSDSDIVFKKILYNVSDNNKIFEPDHYTEFLNGTLNGMSASLAGTDIIDGKDAYILELVPSVDSNKTMATKSRIWINKENWMLVRYEISNENKDALIIINIKDMKINTGISETSFDFKIPEGSTTVLLKQEQFYGELEEMQLEDSQKRVSFEILTPDYMPKGYKLNYTTASSSMDDQYLSFIHSVFSIFAGQAYERVTLVYTNGTNEIHISETLSETNRSNVYDFEKDLTYTNINGSEGRIYPVFEGNMKALEWQSENITINIISSLNESEIISIAESFP
jgi:outer membrane lipoprotein-sorting protein